MRNEKELTNLFTVCCIAWTKTSQWMSVLIIVIVIMGTVVRRCWRTIGVSVMWWLLGQTLTHFIAALCRLTGWFHEIQSWRRENCFLLHFAQFTDPSLLCFNTIGAQNDSIVKNWGTTRPNGKFALVAFNVFRDTDFCELWEREILENDDCKKYGFWYFYLKLVVYF